MNNEKNDSTKYRILIVDDDDTIREMYLHVFQSKNFETVGAKDGIEGIDLATKEKFDVILTGIVMPRMDGFGLISALRENVATKDIPVAIISHLGREEDRRRAHEMNIKTFIIQGSMTPREVVEKIKNLIASSSSFRVAFDDSSWDAPQLAEKLNIPGFNCPNCPSKLIFEIIPKADGTGLDAFLKCPKCDLHL